MIRAVNRPVPFPTARSGRMFHERWYFGSQLAFPEQPRILSPHDPQPMPKPFQTREPRGTPPSGGNSTAKLHVPRAAPRPLGAVWGAGVLPLPPSGGNSAVKPHVPRAAPRPLGAVWGAGVLPLPPSGGNSAAKPHVPRAAPRPTGAVWGAGVLPLPAYREPLS